MKRLIFSVFFLFAFLGIVAAQDYSGYTKCAEQDSLALVALYNAANGPNWFCNQDGFSLANLSDDVLTYYSVDYPNAGMGKWLVGPVKNWFGVLLEKQQIGATTDSVWRVIHVHPTVSRRQAGDNNLKGYIPREMGFLTALKWFKVNGNGGLTGTELPKEIWHPTLEELDIESAYFSGELSKEMRNCTKLFMLNFRYNLLDSVPKFDFLTPYHILNEGVQTFFFYNNRLTYTNIEQSVEYFLTFSNPKQVAYEARQQHDVGQEKEIIVKPGDKVVLSSTIGGKNGGYTWYKKGLNTYMTGSSYTIKSVAAKDTGAYMVLVTNEFVRLNDANSDYSNVFSSPTYVRFVPSNPFVKTAMTNYGGTEINITLNKPMAKPSSSQASEFTVTSNGQPLRINDISLGGRFSEKLILKLADPVKFGETVTVSYTGGTIVCANGGALTSFTNRSVQNLARVTPTVAKTITRNDGSGIFITLDQYVDPASLVASDFTVMANTTTHSIAAVIIKAGEINADISKTFELVLSEPMTSTDAITVSYKRGSLSALYGSPVETFSSMNVENVILENRTSVTIIVEDGTQKLKSIVVKGTMKNLPFTLYDDGTNGDVTANDHIWSKTLDLNDGTYTWEAYNRTMTMDYDTTTTVDANGIITQIITPTEIDKDSLLSGDLSLQFEVADKKVNGDTYYGYKNKLITFILDVSSYISTHPNVEIQPYLMGINSDWSEGLAMTSVADNGSLWTIKIGGFSVGQTVSFNFRNGEDWENNSPLSRNHVVMGNDTIKASFGVVTSSDELTSSKSLKIYPNPVSNKICISVPKDFNANEIIISDVYGKTLWSSKDNCTSIDASMLNRGVYFLRLKDQFGKILISRFIKN
jgi:uncharacterized repeat protein (TIGR02059 family)